MKLTKSVLIFVSALVITLNATTAPAANTAAPGASHDTTITKTGGKFIASGENLQQFFNAVSRENKKTYVVSQMAQKKLVKGEFDIADPIVMIDQLSAQLGLVWYNNGQSMFVYDNSELKNTVINLRNASLTNLTDFLSRAGLSSSHYPIRSEQKSNAIFVSGPPAFIDVVINAASYLDDLYGSSDPQKKYEEPSAAKAGGGYVAKNEGIQNLFSALSSESRKPYVLSKLAQKKSISGDFDLSHPARFLDKLSGQIGLVWYDDGETIYVYDNSELKNAVVMLRHATLTTLNEFLQRTGLLSNRYPIRGEEKNNAFFIAAPPAYVDIVVNAATYLDDLYKNVDLNKQRISIIKLHNTFVNDRKMKVRDQEVTIVGIGKVIEAILANDKKELITLDAKPPSPLAAAGDAGSSERKLTNDNTQIKVIPYPDTNSLLVKGTQEQIDLIQALVEQLDIPKRHIELSLWIIDVNKNDLDKLGVEWQVGLNLGGKAQFNLTTNNGTASSLDGTKFLAQIYALSSKGMADVVSRPIILTQDNVPASFDNNSTFYTKIEGERVASLESVTYGTLINVLPRFSPRGDEVEMILDIEDGQQQDNAVSTGLPTVTRTKLSTIARVPRDKSLLIGGYTLEEYRMDKSKVPLLGDLPFIGGAFRSESESYTKKVRVFLIQPKLIEIGAAWDPKQFTGPAILAPKMPLSETLQLLRSYAEPEHVNH